MGLFSKVSHHLHVRKRVHNNLEQYPHPDKFKNTLDKLIYIVGFLGPILTIPQAYSIYSLKDASGVSLISWVWYLIAAIIWLVYAIVHKEKPLIFTNILWILTDIIIVVGILIY